MRSTLRKNVNYVLLLTFASCKPGRYTVLKVNKQNSD